VTFETCRKQEEFIIIIIIIMALECAECDDSLRFSGDSSIPLCYILFPATLLHQLFFNPPSLPLAIYFLIYHLVLLIELKHEFKKFEICWLTLHNL
jgi:hypothetical protein